MAKVGAGKAEVRLGDVLPFDGFDEVLDSVHARALVVEAGEPAVRVCLVTLEVTSLRADLLAQLRAAAAKAAGCAEGSVWVCVTHTFSAPHARTVSHLANAKEVARNYLLVDAYVASVEEAVTQAAASLEEASLSVAAGTTDVNVNRDVETPGGWWLGLNPNGPSDHGLRALVARREGDGSPAAVLFSADVQSSVLDKMHTTDGLRVVSGDLAGRAAALVERELGCPALFVVGCAADQAPAYQAVTQRVLPGGRVEHDDAHEAAYPHLDELAARLARQLLEALDATRPIACGRVSASAHRITCPGQQRAEFHGLKPMREYEYLPAEPVSTTVSVLELGDLVLVGVAPELSSALGSRIREAAVGPMDVLTMVNGAEKYLPDADAYDKITYEAMNSAFGRGSDEVLAQDVLASVAAVRKGM